MNKGITWLCACVCVATAACGGTMNASVTAATPAETNAAAPEGDAIQPAADAEPAAAVIEHVDGTKVELPGEIEYAFRSAKIAHTTSNEAILGQLLAFLQKNESVTTLRIEGHTDSIGNHARNQRLSEARARSVAKWLVAHGVDESRFHIVGFGPDKPIADNATRDGRAKNRRTEFHLEQIEGKPAEQVLARSRVSTPIVAAAVPAPKPAAPAVTPVAAKAAAPAPATPAAPPAPVAPTPDHGLNIGWDMRMHMVVSFQHAGTSGAFTCSPMPKDHVYLDIVAGAGDVYGQNSAICAAAVYAGKITKEKGGTFTLVYKGRQPSVSPAFTASPKNGITTKEYNGGETFSFEGAAAAPIALGWHNRDSGIENGQRFSNYFFQDVAPGETKTFVCPSMPAGEKPQGVKGDGGEYYAQSWGCWAAVHAGKITPEKGGTFTVVVKGFESSRAVASTTQNGVTSDRDTGLHGNFVTIK